jgi:hypothetical protein
MSKGYVKDTNGKFHLVDKDKQEPIVMVNEGTPETKAWVREIMEGPKMKEFEARLKRLESFMIGAQK